MKVMEVRGGALLTACGSIIRLRGAAGLFGGTIGVSWQINMIPQLLSYVHWCLLCSVCPDSKEHTGTCRLAPVPVNLFGVVRITEAVPRAATFTSVLPLHHGYDHSSRPRLRGSGHAKGPCRFCRDGGICRACCHYLWLRVRYVWTVAAVFKSWRTSRSGG